jgi:RES domain
MSLQEGESKGLKPRPSVRELRKRIGALRRIDLERADVDFLKKLIAPVTHWYLHPAPVIGIGERVFRAVSWEGRPLNKRHLSYAPPHKISSYQRANRPNDPMFYCSVGCSATIMELAPKNRTRLAISTWRAIKQMYVASIGYSEKNFKRQESQRWPQVWWTAWRKGDPEAALSRANQLVHEFLSEEFTKQVSDGCEWQYKLSVAMAEGFLNALPTKQEGLTGLQVSGLLYPSVATQANDDNLVLKRAAADECLEFVSVQYIEVTVKAGTPVEYEMKGLDYADSISATGDIEWKGVFPNTIAPGTDFRLDAEGGEPVMRNALDTIVGRFSEQNK